MNQPVVHSLVLAWAALMLLALTATPNAYADTDVNFSGILVADPCELQVDSENQTIDFGNVPSKTFITSPRSEPERFSLRLSGCDLSLGETVTVIFMGAEDFAQPGLFAVTGTAGGIAIAVEDLSGTPVVPNIPMRPAALSTGNISLNFQAFISAPDFSRVQEGDFECVTTFLLEYD